MNPITGEMKGGYGRMCKHASGCLPKVARHASSAKFYRKGKRWRQTLPVIYNLHLQNE